MSKETMWSQAVTSLKSREWEVKRLDGRARVFLAHQSDQRSMYLHRLYSLYHAKQDDFFYSPEMGYLGGFVELNYEGRLVFLLEGAGIALVRQLYDPLDQGSFIKKGKSSVVVMHQRIDGGQLSLYASGTGDWRALQNCPVLQPGAFRL